ncbi:MAG TPA: asparagine synthase (glutamine-hydrolyzing) [Candidatus Nanoarchaeia archaeon]|nr:asparagine synthase (glutamine-hydrolyzing) [Candidatus Nanoarchaeia archaeon]
MCGINGFNFEDRKILARMNSATAHRGPDGTGEFVDSVSLGHNRLAIIELTDKGKQPMCNADESVWLTFNGEIYNFMELRKELEKKYAFRSHSDSEVIIHAYEEWGEECVNKLNGMWAFCIYDKKKNLFFLSRDRLGKKPIYYYAKKRQFIFSSEIKALFAHPIRKELDEKAIPSFLSYRYVLGEGTFFKDVRKVLPAHNLIFDLKSNKIKRIYEYWDLAPQEFEVDENEAKARVTSLLKESVAYRKISDVPLGVILSGGLDSSLVTALLAKQEDKPVNTFTVKFKEEGFDETAFAQTVSDQYKTNYHEVSINTSNFLELMRNYSAYRDEPIGVPNEIALYLLSKKIKKHVTVVLSGEGADEIFEGYGRKFSSARDYEILHRLQKLPNGKEIYRTKFSKLFEKYKGRFFDSAIDHFMGEYIYWTEEERNTILKPHLRDSSNDFFKKYAMRHKMPYQQLISYLFIKIHLPALLNRLDSSTMASAVEGRAPFLDYRLVEYVFNLPSRYKTRWNISEKEMQDLNATGDELSEKENIPKYLLKEISREYLPDSIVDRKKQGFPLPLDNWFKGEFENIAKKYLLGSEAKIAHFVDQSALRQLLDSTEQRKRWGQKIWMLLSLELWLQEWFS